MPSDGKTRFAMAALQPGTRLNDTYEIDAHVASGGMGEVYRGHNIETGEPVAIKAVLPELARDEAIFALFKKEATVLGRLRHDTIVRYYSFSRDPALGVPYLAMEFVEGIALSERIAQRPLGPREAAVLFTRVAAGLAVAHQAGVIHRDLSPDNIILSNGDVRHPRIIDFGIARSAAAGRRHADRLRLRRQVRLRVAGAARPGPARSPAAPTSTASPLVMIAALKRQGARHGRHPCRGDREAAQRARPRRSRSVAAAAAAVDAGARPRRPAGERGGGGELAAHLFSPTGRRRCLRGCGRASCPNRHSDRRRRRLPPRFPPRRQWRNGRQRRDQPAQRFGPALAAGLVALVLVGGAGAAYLGGLFDRKADGEVAATRTALAADAERRADGGRRTPAARSRRARRP